MLGLASASLSTTLGFRGWHGQRVVDDYAGLLKVGIASASPTTTLGFRGGMLGLASASLDDYTGLPWVAWPARRRRIHWASKGRHSQRVADDYARLPTWHAWSGQRVAHRLRWAS